jgi:hypothetical protein
MMFGELRNMSVKRSENTRLHVGPSWRHALTLCVLIGLIAADRHPAHAADPRAPRGHASPSSVEDCQLAVEARRSMMADPMLAQFNIGVTVADSAATVWGAVPDADTAAKVRSRLSMVAGMSTLIDDLRIDPDCRLWALRSMAPTEVSSPAEQYKTGLASRQPTCGPASFTDTLPPMTLICPSSDPAKTPSVTLLKPTLADANLADQLETLRRTVPRFRDIGFRSLGSVVYLRPHKAPPAMVLEFAGQISHLPGVSRVLIEDSSRSSSLSIP